MPTPFDELNTRDAADLVVIPEGYIDGRAMYDGDMWGEGHSLIGPGRFWIGPRPLTSDAGYVETLTKIKRALISKNVVAEVTNRHVSAILRRPPVWSLDPVRSLADGEQPTHDEQALIDEATGLLDQWWNTRGALAMLQDAAVNVLLGSRAPLRLYVPSGLLIDGSIPDGDLGESMALIYADPVPSPIVAIVAEDASTRQPIGVYLYTVDKVERAEIVFTDGPDTVLKVLSGATDAETFRMDFGGRITMHELKRPALISPQVRQQQMLVNLALTMLGRNVVLGGFLERILLNAQLPGTIERQADGSSRFVPEPLQVGAGTTNVLAGLPVHGDPNDPEKVTSYTTPSVVYRDPVPPDTFIATKAAAYQGILEEVQQLHALISGDAAASGESRKQARADFMSSLADTTTQIEAAGRWLLETLLAMASAFAGQPGRYEGLRAVFTCQIDSGPITAEEQRETRDNVTAGLLSEVTGMARIGVEDTDAEQARIAAQRNEQRAAETTNASAILGRAGILAGEVRTNGAVPVAGVTT